MISFYSPEIVMGMNTIYVELQSCVDMKKDGLMKMEQYGQNT